MKRALVSGMTGISLAAVAAACGPGLDPEVVVHPPQPTTALAKPDADKVDQCAVGEAEPLTVDWLATQRFDLAGAMKEGIAVVSYDCKGLKLLKACKVPGSYAFAGVTPKEESLQLTTPLELRANVPFSAPGLEGEIQRGSAIDVGSLVIGQRSTTMTEALKTDLVGSCEGATHFVRSATVGAFALGTGAQGKPRPLAQIFAAAGASQTGIAAKEGDPDACRGAKADALVPLDPCQAVIRVDLVPVLTKRPARAEPGDKQAEDDARKLTSRCPPQSVRSGPKCAATTAPHLCDPDDARACVKQCDAGDAGSCHHLAYHYLSGKDLARDDAKAAALFERACAAGVARACYARAEQHVRALASAKNEGARAAARSKAQELGAKACDLGDAWACWAVGEWYLREGALAVFPKDPARAVGLLRRSCNLGQGTSCSAVAALQIEGKQTAKDIAGAASLLQRACEGGRAEDCLALGDLLRKGQGLAKDGQKALDVYARGCALGELRACGAAGQVVAEGDGVPKDVAKGYAFLEKGCPDKGFAPEACLTLAGMHEKGTGIPKDTARAAALFERVCGTGGCARAAEIWMKGDGVKADPERALALYETGCTKWSDKKACDALGPLLEKKDKERAKALYADLCARTQDKAACASLKRLAK